MFTIVISEKGGAERRETFEKNEINAGRVQGNDLMLPKGNVSKHHARLLFRDGRFIVTDLKSTNGTYVNGRKISQATIVREGDKIYIGDFVLRLETQQKAAHSPSGSEHAAEPDGHPGGPGSSSVGSTARDGAGEVPSRQLPPPVPPPVVGSAASPSPAVMSSLAPPLVPPPEPPLPSPSRPSEPDAVSPYLLERDPDESGSSPEIGAAPVPKVAGAARVSPHVDMRIRGQTMTLGGERASARRPAPPMAAIPPRKPRSVPPPAASARPVPRETPEQAARRLALITLIDRVADVIDLGPLEQSPVVPEAVSQPLERAVRDQAKAMREEGEAPDSIDLELLARDAVRELVGLGALGPLLDDDDTEEIHVVRPDCVLAIKNGEVTLAEPSFTSEVALARAVARLAQRSGDPLRPGELVVDRRLPRGAYMTAIGPPTAGGWVLRVGKRRRLEASLPDLVRGGSMSQAVATFLEACARSRANILVVGAGAGAVSTLLGAIASAAAPGERVAVLQQGAEEIAIAQAHVIALSLADHGSRGEASVYAAARLGVDRLIVASLGGNVATATIDVIAEGSDGVLAGIGAPSLRHGLARVAMQVALARSGASVEAALAAVAESFDLAVEVQRVENGRMRIRRVVELDGTDQRSVVTRDLFVLNAEAAGDAAYVETGASQFLVRAGG